MGVVDQPWYIGGTTKHAGNIRAIIQANVTKPSQMLHIGTDAQKIGRKTDFVTVVCMHDLEFRHGGRLWYTRSRMNPKISLREKLFMETWYSLELGLDLVQFVPSGFEQITVHIDANPEKNVRGEFRWASGQFSQQLATMVMSNGFRYVLKPDAWAASHGADHLVNNKHLTSRQRRKRRIAARGRTRRRR